MNRIYRSLLVVVCVAGSAPAAGAAIMTYNNSADFLADVTPVVSYDFERASGFIPNVPIGVRDGIIFDAWAVTYLNPTSGTQAMTGPNGNFSPASIDFSNWLDPPDALGFYGLDLIGTSETLNVLVTFANQGPQHYALALNGNPNYTPIYFGIRDLNDAIVRVDLSGSNFGFASSWLIDDLTIGRTSQVPEPITLAGVALGGVVWLGRRRRVF